MRFHRFVICSAIAVAATACASSSSTSANAGVAGRTQPKVSSPDYVTSIEIEKTSSENAFELISRLRPRWLTAPGGTASLGGGARSQVIVVYLDGARVGVKENLRSISSSGIVSMRYYDATRAATILNEGGSEPIAGAIVISTKRQ